MNISTWFFIITVIIIGVLFRFRIELITLFHISRCVKALKKFAQLNGWHIEQADFCDLASRLQDIFRGEEVDEPTQISGECRGFSLIINFPSTKAEVEITEPPKLGHSILDRRVHVITDTLFLTKILIKFQENVNLEFFFKRKQFGYGEITGTGEQILGDDHTFSSFYAAFGNELAMRVIEENREKLLQLKAMKFEMHGQNDQIFFIKEGFIDNYHQVQSAVDAIISIAESARHFAFKE